MMILLKNCVILFKKTDSGMLTGNTTKKEEKGKGYVTGSI